MHFPKELFNAYQAIKNCALVKNKDYSPAALSEFESLLNDAQPTEDHKERFLTVKDIYNMNKFGFQKYIRGAGDFLILWTESKSIVNWFHLRGLVYLSYDHKENQYKVQRHRNLDSDNPIAHSDDSKYGYQPDDSEFREQRQFRPQRQARPPKNDMFLSGFPDMNHHEKKPEAKDTKEKAPKVEVPKMSLADFPGLAVKPQKPIISLTAQKPVAETNDDDEIVFG